MLPSAHNAAGASVASLLGSDVWRANEIARGRATTFKTGFAALDSELPDGGWPRSTLTELLLQQHGLGEMQLLKPMLADQSKARPVAFIQPPYLPQIMAAKAWGLNTGNLLWVRPTNSADALWTTEQILRNGSCAAVVLWQTNTRPESLRRLNLAAQSSETWLWVVRPLARSADASPSPLRLALRPAIGGVSVEIVKRRGPHLDNSLFIQLNDMPARRQPLEQDDAALAEPIPAAHVARVAAPTLV